MAKSEVRCSILYIEKRCRIHANAWKMVLANTLSGNAVPTAEIGHRRIFAGLAASLSCLIGLTVLLGWIIDVPVLRSVVPGAVEMKANTAIGLLFVSAAVFVATALFGGMTPLVATWLIEVTGDKAAPGLWMSLGGACGLFATLVIYRRRAAVPAGVAAAE